MTAEKVLLCRLMYCGCTDGPWITITGRTIVSHLEARDSTKPVGQCPKSRIMKRAGNLTRLTGCPDAPIHAERTLDISSTIQMAGGRWVHRPFLQMRHKRAACSTLMAIFRVTHLASFRRGFPAPSRSRCHKVSAVACSRTSTCGPRARSRAAF